ncbi:hypothetical protein EDB92DRAFT_1818959 [Lactarius akahatsu]|uniref:Uncharacterized protein n=1 Tax=Lactarius akahatsu TaxID=416441 RepID=A0AAD4QAL5_9AGAM|nr:hypothetical protein EDB92DRAFT_1818959 [Lactarius akahatsu]
MILALDCIATVALHATVVVTEKPLPTSGMWLLDSAEVFGAMDNRPAYLWRGRSPARIVGVIVGRRRMSGVFSVSSVVAGDLTAAKSNVTGVSGKVSWPRPKRGRRDAGQNGVAGFKCWALAKGSASIGEPADGIGDIRRRKEEMGWFGL